MAELSQSHFLQSLGWATLNSFWQMALIWCLYLGINSIFRLNARTKYQLAATALFTGFTWFTLSFIFFFLGIVSSPVLEFNQQLSGSGSLWNIILVSASFTYLMLLVFPTWKLYRNWRFVKMIRKEGLEKADLGFRLFVQKVSAQMGITKKVMVYISSIVTSPLTIGYLKPIILLPVAAMNSLSVQQAEAILLHELSHIRRYDYLLNLIISVINTLLYFNPFVKLFIRVIEAEREACCDEMVLQFGYDKVGYASALLSLEKSSSEARLLAIGATGKHNLLHRIEKIVGMEKKKKFSINQFAVVLAALLCILIFNSLLILKEEKKNNYSFAYNSFANPLVIFNSEYSSRDHSITPVPATTTEMIAVNNKKDNIKVSAVPPVHVSNDAIELVTEPVVESPFIQVAADDIDLSLTIEEKEQVKTTVAATRKVVSALQWKEIEKSIADAMDKQEKARAKNQYLSNLEKTINWKNIENNLKAKYEDVNWNEVNSNIDQAMAAITADSLQEVYTRIYKELSKTQQQLQANNKNCVSPMPDASIEEISKAKAQMAKEIEKLKSYTSPKKVVRL